MCEENCSQRSARRTQRLVLQALAQERPGAHRIAEPFLLEWVLQAAP
jgi:hypothetical protein